MEKIGVYPGSFDPVTLGHLDVIERATKVFDKVIVAVMQNGSKKPVFTVAERMEFLKRTTSHLQNVEIDGFSGLLANYVDDKGACAIVKGLRAVSDFDYEFSMALGNRKLNPNIDTVFFMTSAQYMFLSSSMIKDIALHGGCIGEFVPKVLQDEIIERMTNGG